MAYAGIDKKQFARLLERGTGDGELRRFFVDNRTQLILMGAKKVQNPPYDKHTCIRMLTHGLPSKADPVLQKWCAENLTMPDPEPVVKLVDTLRMYQDEVETPPEDEAKRLARSCLVHLFKASPAPELMSFLRQTQAGSNADVPGPKEVSAPAANEPGAERLPATLGAALVALAEGRDPDEHLSSLSPTLASFVAGLHAVRSGQDDEVKVVLEALETQPEMHASLDEYAKRSAVARARLGSASRGLQILHFSDPDETVNFDFDRDEVITICTKGIPDTPGYVRPFAIRCANGAWISLSENAYRKKIFYDSGNLIAFSSGRDALKQQPKRGEIGIWRVAKNEDSDHSTKFHITSNKTPVYEVRNVPFASTEYDSVREHIKHQVEMGDPSLAKTSLFMLRDELFVGFPSGKGLARDESFEAGLPSWRALSAFSFEGRTFVPGPLPSSEIYECETLGSSLKKLLASGKANVDKPTKAQVRKLQELLASGATQLNLARADRLRAELDKIEEHDEAMAVLLEEVMHHPRITSRVDELVKNRVDALVSKKEELHKDVENLEQKKANLVEQQRLAEKEQRAIAPSVAKAVRGAFDKARGDAFGTLGQVAVFKALIDELVERPGATMANVSTPLVRVGAMGAAITARVVNGGCAPISETLHSLGVPPKHAKAIETVGKLAHECGLILIIDGLAARIATELWLGEGARTGKVLDCGIGITDDNMVRDALADGPDAIAILDANLSPMDVYARPLIDMVQRRLSGIGGTGTATRSLISISGGIVALPLPPVVEAISLRVSLDRSPPFLQESDAVARLKEIEMSGEMDGWFECLWKPAAERVRSHLQSMTPTDATLVLSVLDAQVQTPSNAGEE
ncbi:hypothetical protein [Verminephrobacter eiseniae]|uniref:hypothetical protein n=1 Tax=Verminephrobacter eiseniae TaxID=364317 RepID=UPI002238EFCF|nr:hypothetical protein [Verminephrobacter eiseniae]MCW5232496.1 hypothetical protein [Verminephrobacter eiseniae]MCW5295938.1 hypothetical protein [Verminephrobacter eiseniae]MCW8184017.1 hypothetical protein [Verminephrobacter eiseniae]MCW8221589.1 hypothetical protein [Verminephrobacter eiseniae]MCW8232628.1 hypothetical protein [Verminephrobacter eiseniae]